LFQLFYGLDQALQFVFHGRPWRIKKKEKREKSELSGEVIVFNFKIKLGYHFISKG
jgi:hypothetical protein